MKDSTRSCACTIVDRLHFAADVLVHVRPRRLIGQNFQEVQPRDSRFGISGFLRHQKVHLHAVLRYPVSMRGVRNMRDMT